MTTAILTWYNCGKKGHHARACQGENSKISRPTGAHHKSKNNESSMGKPVSKVRAEHMWCSVHETDFQDDTDRYVQRSPPPSKNGGAHIVASVLLNASSPPVNDDENCFEIHKGFALLDLWKATSKGFFTPTATASR